MRTNNQKLLSFFAALGVSLLVPLVLLGGIFIVPFILPLALFGGAAFLIGTYILKVGHGQVAYAYKLSGARNKLNLIVYPFFLKTNDNNFSTKEVLDVG